MSRKILEIDNVTVSFDGFKALNQLNFSMDEGELRVIIGPNGAGKTTFLDVITGKVRPTSGEARFKGKNLGRQKEYQIARLGIGRKFQTPRVYLNLTPRENLEISCTREKNVFSTLFKQAPTAERRTVGGLLETIGLAHKADIAAGLLSHGEKQWLEIGMLVAQSPDLLLVDEPVAGLTDEETERTGDLLLALAESHSVIVIEHDMEFVRQIARQVTVLHEGSVLCEGTMDNVQNDPRVIEVYLGQEASLTPEQMLILRIAVTMAWADQDFSIEEQLAILDRLSSRFADDSALQADLREELKNYLAKRLPLEELVPQLKTPSQKESALKLSYEVISYGDINRQEAQEYQHLLNLLNLPDDTVRRLEADALAQAAN
ncbi:MAG: urea ABC transporter ATP-binding protein UrtD [Cyanobacteria bacterium P01_H01_bin.119]